MAVPELKAPPVIAILTAVSDPIFKQFLAVTKNLLPPNLQICPMRTAIDIAVRSKPPLIKPPQPDIMNISGDLVALVVTNWLNTQLRKPPPKAAPAKKPPAKRAGKAQTASAVTPSLGDSEGSAPFFVLLTDYPKTLDQFRSLVSGSCPVISLISLEGQAGLESDRRSAGGAAKPDPVVDWKALFSKDFPFFGYNFAFGAPEEVTQRMLNDLMSCYVSYLKYQRDFLDVRFVDIPRYPTQPLPIPQVVPEKPTAQKGVAAGKGTAAVPPPLPTPVADATSALVSAYSRAVLSQLDDYLTLAAQPRFSLQFMHVAEFLQSFALPASLSIILSHRADRRCPELFTMRMLAHSSDIPYNTIFNVMMIKTFEELIGYGVGERRHIEQIPLDFVPNIMAPLLATYSKYKAIDFGGCTLLAFFHEIPSELPIMQRTETFALPVYHAFGRWLETQPPVEPKLDDGPPQTEIGINVSSADLFKGFPSDNTTSTVTTYLCESGLRVDTYPPVLANNVVESLSFIVYFGQVSRFSFHMSQKPAEGHDEEEDSVETAIKIRGVLSPGCEFFLEHSADKALFVIITRNARIEFDVIRGRTIVVGAPDETYRIITPEGNLIRFAPHPIIFRPDGSIQQSIKGTWHLVDSAGKAFVKKKGKWFQDPDHDTTSETIETYFIDRKVTNRSDGVSFVTDSNNVTVSFPDGTKFAQKDKIWSHPMLPDFQIADDRISIDTAVFKGTFSHNKNCTFELKNGECTITFQEAIRHLLIEFRHVVSMIDLISGIVVNVGSRRYVYYLNDDWQWNFARQLCSRKDIMQHFENGEFVDRLKAVVQVEKAEIETIVCTGQKPRLFVIERDGNALTVKELLAAADFQAISELSATRITKKDDGVVTLWFDTEPKSYREVRITTKISDEIKQRVFNGMEQQRETEDNRKAVLNSVGNPKWKELEAREKQQEADVRALLAKYNAAIPG